MSRDPLHVTTRQEGPFETTHSTSSGDLGSSSKVSGSVFCSCTWLAFLKHPSPFNRVHRTVFILEDSPAALPLVLNLARADRSPLHRADAPTTHPRRLCILPSVLADIQILTVNLAHPRLLDLGHFRCVSTSDKAREDPLACLDHLRGRVILQLTPGRVLCAP